MHKTRRLVIVIFGPLAIGVAVFGGLLGVGAARGRGFIRALEFADKLTIQGQFIDTATMKRQRIDVTLTGREEIAPIAELFQLASPDMKVGDSLLMATGASLGTLLHGHIAIESDDGKDRGAYFLGPDWMFPFGPTVVELKHFDWNDIYARLKANGHVE